MTRLVAPTALHFAIRLATIEAHLCFLSQANLALAPLGLTAFADGTISGDAITIRTITKIICFGSAVAARSHQGLQQLFAFQSFSTRRSFHRDNFHPHRWIIVFLFFGRHVVVDVLQSAELTTLQMIPCSSTLEFSNSTNVACVRISSCCIRCTISLLHVFIFRDAQFSCVYVKITLVSHLMRLP